MESSKKSRTPGKSPRKPYKDPKGTGISDAESVFSVSSMDSSTNVITSQLPKSYVSRSERSTTFQTVQPSQSLATPTRPSSDTELLSPNNPHVKMMALVNSLDEGTNKIASESEAFSKAAAARRENSKNSSLVLPSTKIQESLNEISISLKAVATSQSMLDQKHAVLDSSFAILNENVSDVFNQMNNTVQALAAQVAQLSLATKSLAESSSNSPFQSPIIKNQ